MTKATLNPKQALFVAEYLVDGNATQAAIRAGYSAKTAQPASSRLLSHVMVQAAITKGQERQRQRAEQQQDDVCDRMRTLAYADRTQAFDAAGNVKPMSEWPPELRYALEGFKVVKRNVAAGDGHTDVIWEPKFASKLGAHVEVARMEGRYAEKVEHRHLVMVADGLAAGRDRSRAKKLAQSAQAVIDVKAEPDATLP